MYNDEKEIIVPVCWFEELIKLSDVYSDKKIDLYKLNALMGFISSAHTIIKYGRKNYE